MHRQREISEKLPKMSIQTLPHYHSICRCMWDFTTIGRTNGEPPVGGKGIYLVDIPNISSHSHYCCKIMIMAEAEFYAPYEREALSSVIEDDKVWQLDSGLTLAPVPICYHGRFGRSPM